MANIYKPGDLRVWYIPQIPGEPFTVDVPDVATARLVLDALVGLSAHEYANRIKPDYADVGGVSMYEPAGATPGYEWGDYELADEDDVDALVSARVALGRVPVASG